MSLKGNATLTMKNKAQFSSGESFQNLKENRKQTPSFSGETRGLLEPRATRGLRTDGGTEEQQVTWRDRGARTRCRRRRMPARSKPGVLQGPALGSLRRHRWRCQACVPVGSEVWAAGEPLWTSLCSPAGPVPWDHRAGRGASRERYVVCSSQTRSSDARKPGGEESWSGAQTWKRGLVTVRTDSGRPPCCHGRPRTSTFPRPSWQHGHHLTCGSEVSLSEKQLR